MSFLFRQETVARFKDSRGRKRTYAESVLFAPPPQTEGRSRENWRALESRSLVHDARTDATAGIRPFFLPQNLWRGVRRSLFSGIDKIVGLSVVMTLLLGFLVFLAVGMGFATGFNLTSMAAMLFGGLALLLIFAIFVR